MDVTNSKNIEIKIVKDLGECRVLWNRFSPKKTIYDDWDFRFLFHKYHQHNIHWIVAYNKNEPLGLLPLQYNTITKQYEFWGGDYMEDNRAYVILGYEHIIPTLYASIPPKNNLQYIVGEDEYTKSLPVEDFKYIITIDPSTSFETYLANHFDSETRGKFRRKIKHIQNLGIIVHKNRAEDMEILFKFNLERFQENSSFADRPYHREIFLDLFKTATKPHLLSYEINGQTQAVSFGTIYNEVYEYFNLGVSLGAHKDLPTFVHYTNFMTAVEEKTRLFDAFTGAYGWKELWHMDKVPQHRYTDNKTA